MLKTNPYNKLEPLRTQLAGELEALFADMASVGRAHGRYLFEGEWRTREEISRLYAELKRKDRRIFFELLLVMLGLAGGTGLVVLILYSACCRG